MEIYHLNCGTLCPPSALFINGTGSLLEKARLICHCLLIKTQCSGLVLVDTGIGQQDIKAPEGLGPIFEWLATPTFDIRETARYQIENMGFNPEDVRHIIVTHLDPDHAGGLADFPNARIHVYRPEYEAAIIQKGWTDKLRYLPRQWHHEAQWEVYDSAKDIWCGLEAIKTLRGLEGEDIYLIPFPGHTRGHVGVAIRDNRGWLLHCGDAYFHRGQLAPLVPYCPPGLAIFQALDQWNLFLWGKNILRIRTIHKKYPHSIGIFCSHDPNEFNKFKPN